MRSMRIPPRRSTHGRVDGSRYPGGLSRGDGVEAAVRYARQPVRPWAQIGVRAALWGAVLVGCVGGGVALLRPGAAPPPAAASGAVEDPAIPAAVAGVAERAVRAWLTATDGDEESLGALFVEPPPVNDADSPTFEVVRLTTIGGRTVDEGYWTVTVAADVTEPASTAPASGESAGDPASGDGAGSTLFVEVGVVGSPDGGLAVLATPAVVPAPPAVSSDWRLLGGDEAADGDPLATAVRGFLAALLTGEGDVTRYVATEGATRAVVPAPFTEISVGRVTVAEIGDGETLARAEIRATTRHGIELALAYDVVLTQASGRWEVVGYSGAPALSSRPTATTQPPQDTSSTSAASSTSATSDTSPPPPTGSTSTVGPGE